MKSMESTSFDELLQTANKLREEVVSKAEQLHNTYSLLYSKARRDLSEDTPHYVMISNAGRRFAGLVLQGAKRTEAVDRHLAVTMKTRREAQEREETEKQRKAQAQRSKEEARKAVAASRDVYEVFGSSNTKSLIEELLAQGSVASDLNDLYGDDQ